MIIYPAIDLRQGKCIRLYQGDYQRETIYSTDPFATANSFVAASARWLHIVDLDGAKDPEQGQGPLIAALIKTNKVNVQTGGGIRTKAQIVNLLEQGVARVIIGSMAVQGPQEVAEWFRFFGAERLVLALDVIVNENKPPMVAVNAWQTTGPFALDELIHYYQAVGLRHLLCTNISLDGTLQGPDYGLYETLLKKFPDIALQASGGIHALSDISRLRENQLSGAIIGRALYENKFTVGEALAC